MDKSISYLVCMLCFTALVSCARTPAVPGAAPRAQYDDSVYCFNRRAIVTLDGRKGMVDDGGEVILPPEWDSMEFLDDDTALLSKGGLWYLCTGGGRIFAQSADSSELEASSRRLHDEMLEADMRYWDAVLDRLQALSTACIAAGPGKPGESVVRERTQLQILLSDAPGGPMNSAQQARLSEIEAGFKSMYGK